MVTGVFTIVPINASAAGISASTATIYNMGSTFYGSIRQTNYITKIITNLHYQAGGKYH